MMHKDPTQIVKIASSKNLNFVFLRSYRQCFFIFPILENSGIIVVEDFVEKYRLDCRLAMARIKEDRPITQRDNKGNFNALIGEIVALFITIEGKISIFHEKS